MGFFDLPFITKIRRNHGLEHATIHILSKKKRRSLPDWAKRLAGIYPVWLG